MSELLSRFAALPGYGIGGLLVLLAYAIESEVRFGARARTIRAGSTDRSSTLAVAACAAVPALGFVLAMKVNSPGFAGLLPAWFRAAALPGMPATAWAGVTLGAGGIALRLWALLTLGERYTRTLLIHDEHRIERGGPYRRVRHPGYLGSLLALNGVAVASGNAVVLLASLAATAAAYGYRIRVEDRMLVAALGDAYADYRRDVRALLPSLRARP